MTLNTFHSLKSKCHIPEPGWSQLYTVKPFWEITIPNRIETVAEESNDWMKVTQNNNFVPMRSIIYSGSFNPPHHGHALIIKALRKMYPDRKVFTEVCIKPFEKAPLDYLTIIERVATIRNKFQSLIDGIVISSASFFIDKIHLLGYTHYYAIGADTYNRLFDSKSYSNKEDLVRMISFCKSVEVKFIVSQRKGVELLNWELFKHLCILVPKDLYADDGISSSQLRANETPKR